MTFTYDLASADADTLAVSKIRLEIGDTVSGTGVLPSGTNLTDEELLVWYERENSDVMRAAAAACEALARTWRRAADVGIGPRKESLSQVAAGYAADAKRLREQYGGGTSAFSAGWARQDGYHDLTLSTDYSQDGYGEEAQ